jgi:hypothetical protein
VANNDSINQRKSRREIGAREKWRAEYRARRFVRQFGLNAALVQENAVVHPLDALLQKFAGGI